MVRRARFKSWVDVNGIRQMLVEEIVSNIYDFVLNALFDLQPLKRFGCRCGASA